MIDRIKKLVRFYELSDRAFAIKCGLKQNTFSNQLSGERALSLNTINAILANCQEISSEWLMRGRGEMLVEDNRDENLKRIASLVDTISMMTSSIREKDERIKELEAKLKSNH